MLRRLNAQAYLTHQELLELSGQVVRPCRNMQVAQHENEDHLVSEGDERR